MLLEAEPDFEFDEHDLYRAESSEKQLAEEESAEEASVAGADWEGHDDDSERELELEEDLEVDKGLTEQQSAGAPL